MFWLYLDFIIFSRPETGIRVCSKSDKIVWHESMTRHTACIRTNVNIPNRKAELTIHDFNPDNQITNPVAILSRQATNALIFFVV